MIVKIMLPICMHFTNFKHFSYLFHFFIKQFPMMREGKSTFFSFHTQGKQCSERLDDLPKAHREQAGPAA